MSDQTVNLRCPVCHQLLLSESTQLKCVAGHSFDRARQGYFNLLLAHKKKSRHPGDNKEMLQSRRRFLEQNFYLPLVVALSEAASSTNGPLLDLGCGEGYFLRGLAQPSTSRELYGVDVSKDAIIMAAKVSPEMHFFVASNHDLPFVDSQFDFVFSINAPVKGEEVARVLSQRGVYVRVTPAAQHLISLKQFIYDTPKPHDEEAPNLAGMRCVEQKKIAFDISVQAGYIFDLLKMTPYYWHASEEVQKNISNMSELKTKAEFCLDFYHKD